MRPPFISRKPIRIETPGVAPAHGISATCRQEMVPGITQGLLAGASVVMVGAGALGGEISEALIRMGIGRLTILDGDVVHISNLARQKFFVRDLEKNKAIRICKNLAGQATARSVLVGIPMNFEEAVASGQELGCSVAVVAVDNDAARAYASKFFRERNTPLVITGVSKDADRGYVFIQDATGSPCIACLMPEVVTNKEINACVPGIIDISKIISGYACFGVVSLITGRRAHWNYRQLSISGAIPEVITMIAKDPNCELCGG